MAAKLGTRKEESRWRIENKMRLKKKRVERRNGQACLIRKRGQRIAGRRGGPARPRGGRGNVRRRSGGRWDVGSRAGGGGHGGSRAADARGATRVLASIGGEALRGGVQFSEEGSSGKSGDDLGVGCRFLRRRDVVGSYVKVRPIGAIIFCSRSWS